MPQEVGGTPLPPASHSLSAGFLARLPLTWNPTPACKHRSNSPNEPQLARLTYLPKSVFAIHQPLATAQPCLCSGGLQTFNVESTDTQPSPQIRAKPYQATPPTQPPSPPSDAAGTGFAFASTADTMSGRKLGGGRVLGSGKGLAPPSPAQFPRAASPFTPSESSTPSTSLSPSLSPLPDFTQDLTANVNLGGPSSGAASGSKLVCPICEEEMVRHCEEADGNAILSTLLRRKEGVDRGNQSH